MSRLIIGMDGASMDLESVRRLVALADHLDFPDDATVSTNITYIGLSVPETEIKWDTVMRPGQRLARP